MIKILYKIFRKKILDCVVEELIGEVPEKVTVQAIEIIAEKKAKFQKWLLYQAHYLQRRDIADIKSKDVVFGQLIFIKAMLHLVNQTRSVEEGKSATEVRPASTLQDDLRRVNDFKNRKAVEKPAK